MYVKYEKQTHMYVKCTLNQEHVLGEYVKCTLNLENILNKLYQNDEQGLHYNVQLYLMGVFALGHSSGVIEQWNMSSHHCSNSKFKLLLHWWLPPPQTSLSRPGGLHFFPLYKYVYILVQKGTFVTVTILLQMYPF